MSGARTVLSAPGPSTHLDVSKPQSRSARQAICVPAFTCRRIKSLHRDPHPSGQADQPGESIRQGRAIQRPGRPGPREHLPVVAVDREGDGDDLATPARDQEDVRAPALVRGRLPDYAVIEPGASKRRSRARCSLASSAELQDPTFLAHAHDQSAAGRRWSWLKRRSSRAWRRTR